MGEALNGLKRTMMCGEPREVNVGEKITLMGWVQRNRKLGGLQFIDLRDRTGIMQIVFGEEINAESFEKAKAVRPEYCIAVTGEVVLREAPNNAMETGMVELKCESIKVLSESETPPIYIKEDLDNRPIYNDIENFLWSIKQEPISEPDNKTKIINHGFDLKTSFRKM